ncbi:hypothetical protein SLS58_007312 [Diplodia intermedia]|uniref:Uncharacterized protein n=1 Tax=Diplodia intermedia TaxID=856260 RepID=A0ABR3TKL4_9PEZI
MSPPRGMKLRSGHVKADLVDKPRVTKRKQPAPRTPLAAPEQAFISKWLTRLHPKFRWTEKRDRSLLIHLIGLGGAITDEEYARLATLWEGATADDVHARVEFLRAQQILTIRAEETAEAAAEAYPESARADNVDHAANVEEPVSEETSSPRSPSPSLDHEALSPPPSSPTSSSSSSSAASDDEDDNNTTVDDNDDNEAQLALKPARKSVRFASPVIATVWTISREPNSRRTRIKPRKWFPRENAPWEDEMFSAEDASDSASTASSSSRRRKRAAADDDDDEDLARPAKRRSSSSISDSDDDDDNNDNDNEEEETEVSYPLSHTARSPRVPRTRAGSSLTASNVRSPYGTPLDMSPRAFKNSVVTWPRPVRAMAAVAEGQEWQDESEDEGETAVIAGDKRFLCRDAPEDFQPEDPEEEYYFPRVRFASGDRLPAATVQPDLGWHEPEDQGCWEYEREDSESEEEDYSVEDGDVDDMVVEEAERLAGGRRESHWWSSLPAQPIYDTAQSALGQQAEGGASAPYYGGQFAGYEYGNPAGGWYPSEAPQEELADDGPAGQQYVYPPPPVDDGGNTPYPGLDRASSARFGRDVVAEHPQQQQQYMEESEEVEERVDDDDDDWSYFNQFDDGSFQPGRP